MAVRWTWQNNNNLYYCDCYGGSHEPLFIFMDCRGGTESYLFKTFHVSVVIKKPASIARGGYQLAAY